MDPVSGAGAQGDTCCFEEYLQELDETGTCPSGFTAEKSALRVARRHLQNLVLSRDTAAAGVHGGADEGGKRVRQDDLGQEAAPDDQGPTLTGTHGDTLQATSAAVATSASRCVRWHISSLLAGGL
ncbi:hypothetical protein WJX81_004127 [Elliptochloris bilobata]|uniref:Uncharacterized protein n=1 Tax=Elliptochloris bilobata TaxID=381761 RepID=A0AAW1S3W1_9CHLO